MKKVRLIGLGWMIIVLGVVAFLGCNKGAEEKTAAQKTRENSLSPSQDLARSALRTAPKEWEPYQSTTPPIDMLARGKRGALRRGHRFSQRIEVTVPPQTLQPNQTVVIPVSVKNIGPEPWPTNDAPSGTHPVNFSYHWITGDTRALSQKAPDGTIRGQLDRPQRRRRLPRTDILRNNGRVVVLEGIRTPLPKEIAPGEEIHLNATIQAPPQAGTFILRLTMVREGEEWFENRGGKPLDLPVTIAAQ
jgi:hypothetical protein